LASDARYLAEKLPNTRLHIEEGAGHLEGLFLTENILDMLVSLVPAGNGS
jgi:hypothetical protein